MKISVITINRNNEQGLRKTMESVLSQSFKDIEYVIVDGASTDGSVETAKKTIENTTAEIPIHFSSEPDTGIYNAMNKGVQKASGEYLLFLNSGDTLSNPEILSKVLSKNHDEDIIAGKVNLTENDQIIRKDVGYNAGEKITLLWFYLLGLPHQGSLIRRNLLLKHPYDETCKINSDWKFFLQTIIMDDVSFVLIDDTISNYDTSGISSQNKELLYAERRKNFHEIVPPRIATDYDAIIPHYYEYIRIEWLLKHKFFYVPYRLWTSLGMKLFK